MYCCLGKCQLRGGLAASDDSLGNWTCIYYDMGQSVARVELVHCKHATYCCRLGRHNDASEHGDATRLVRGGRYSSGLAACGMVHMVYRTCGSWTCCTTGGTKRRSTLGVDVGACRRLAIVHVVNVGRWFCLTTRMRTLKTALSSTGFVAKGDEDARDNSPCSVARTAG